MAVKLGGVMYEDDSEPVAVKQRASVLLDKVERVYLRVLRAAILVIATLLLLYAAWLAVSSTYKLSQSTDSVSQEEVVVVADDITNAEVPAVKEQRRAGAGPAANATQAAYYRDFAGRYHGLYRRKFEPYRQQGDKQLALGEFDDSFVNTAERLKAVTAGELSFEDDRADLESLYRVMAEAADKPLTKERLARYRAAKKVPVRKQVQRTRTEYRQGWDSSSTACEDWYETPYGCSVRRAIEVPYTAAVTEMEYPAGTRSHSQIFRAFQERYFKLLAERREASAAKAEDERQSILEGFVDGRMSLMTALQVLGAFVALMFFFLLIAIERHQRRLAGEVEARSVAT